MPDSRFRSDRATMFVVAAVLVAAAAAVWVATRHTEMATTARPVAIALAVVAVALLTWALLGRRAEAAQRDALDKTVDDEMGRKWAPGFAAAVGAFDKPWYVLAGEPGVGKTAALRAGRLPMALGPDGQPVTDAEQGKQGTYLFDWWFFQDAVVLDSAGDLIAHTDDRWAAFLGRIRDARPDRPVNGMLLAVSAADLIAGDAEQLRAKAELLARQVRVARAELRVRFPLYLLVTKADLIPGFADFFPTGSDLKASFQILGWSDDRDPRRRDAPVTTADVKRGLDGLVADLRRRRTRIESSSTTGRPDAEHRLDHLDEMFAFPAAAAAALDNVAPFVAALLEHVNASDVADVAAEPVAPPFFRGVYLTSALRTGEALDAELAKAFGTELRPTARRAASDRAFFIRDLLLEKIVPEAGMVAPLTAVPAAAGRRSRQIAAAAAAAAAVVVAATAIGYRTTVARARGDRDFWDAMAATPANQLPTLFDAAGRYHGADDFHRRTVLATFERSADLASVDTASPLLPASATLNRDRVAAHADLFRQLAFAPALVPGPFAPTDVPPEKGTAAVLAALLDTRGTKPAPVATLRSDAAALVPLRPAVGDRTRVVALLAGGVPAVTPAGDPASVVSLTDAQRQHVADGVVAWVAGELDDRRKGTAAVTARATAVANDAAELAAVLDAFQRAAQQAAVPEDLVDPIRVLDRAVAAHPAVADAAAVDRRTLSAALKPPPELAAVAAAVGKLGDADADVRRRLAGAVLAYNDFLAAQMATDPVSPVARENLRSVDGRGTPLVLARVRWFRAAATQARDVVGSTADLLRGRTDPPAVALAPVLRQLDAQQEARDKAADADPLGLGSYRDRAADDRAATHLTALAARAAHNAAWTAARPADPSHQWPATAAPAADGLSGWLAAQSAVEAALRVQPPANVDAARAWVDASHAQLAAVARGRYDAWAADADRQVGPPVRTWADVGRLVAAGPAVTRSAAVAARVAPDRDGVLVLRRQDLFPDLKQVAASWIDTLDNALSADAAGHYEAIREFLAGHGFGTDPVDAVRAKLVDDPAALDAMAQLGGGPPRSAVEAYWQGALTTSVGLLSDAARRQATAALRDLRADVVGRYPLDADGTAAWDGVVDPKLAAGLALADGSDNPLVRQIQGLDVVTEPWQRYLATLKGVVALAQHPPRAWTVTVRPTGTADDDSWAAVAAGPAADGEASNWHRFGQHRSVPLPWPAIAGGLSVRLSHDPDGRGPVPAVPELARPWAVYRMALGDGTATDPTARVVVRLDRHQDAAVAVTPGGVPPAP